MKTPLYSTCGHLWQQKADKLEWTYKAVSSGLAGLFVSDHHRLVDVTETLEIFAKWSVVGVIRQPADKDFGVSCVFLHGGVHYL